MLIMTADRMKVCNWGTGENIRIEDWTRVEREGCHAVYLGSQSTALFRGTKEDCKAVLHLIFMAHGAREDYIVPTAEELEKDSYVMAQCIAYDERVQRDLERDVALEQMADGCLEKNATFRKAPPDAYTDECPMDCAWFRANYCGGIDEGVTG